MQRTDTLEKTMMMGKIEGRRRRGRQRRRWLDGITDLMDISLSKLWELVMDREGLACCAPWGRRVGHNWATELNWTLLRAKAWVLSRVCICDRMDSCPPHSSVLGIYQTRTLEWAAISYEGIFLTQESHPHVLCFLHWQVDLLPLTANNPLYYPNEHCFWHWVFNTTVLSRKSGAQCQLQPLYTHPCRLLARHFHALQTVYKIAPEKLKGEAFTSYTFKADLKQRASFVLIALDLGLGWLWAQPHVQLY